MAFGRGHGDAEDFSGFLKGQADKVTQLGQLGFLWVFRSQFIEHIVNRQKLVIIRQGSNLHIFYVHAHLPATVARRALSPRRIYEDMPHGLRGGRIKVRPPGKSARLVPGQPQPGLVNQCRGLEGVPGSLASHLERGQFAQVLVNQRQQFIRRRAIALCQRFQNAGDVAHCADRSMDFQRLQRSGLSLCLY